MPASVHAVIAVKALGLAKSRLSRALSPDERARLVLAMLDDCLTAVDGVDAIRSTTVVTPDPDVATVALGRGAHVHPEPTPLPHDDNLNAALAHAGDQLRRTHGPVGLLALQADLPALRSAELSQMLSLTSSRSRAIVVDHHGTGTAALLTRDTHAGLDPRFGDGSARRHLGSGAIALDGYWPGLRLDVDTAHDLDLAVDLGPGRATRRLLDEIGWPRWRMRKFSPSITTSGCRSFET